MKTLLATIALAFAMVIGLAPAQAAPAAPARATIATVEPGATLVHRRYYRRHYGYRHYGYRNYGYRPYAYYPRHYYRPYYYPRYRSYSGFSFHIGPRFRHAYYYH